MMRALRAVIIAAFCGLSVAEAANVEGIATLDGSPAVHAIVYLESANGTGPVTAAAPRAVMDQKNLSFLPWALPVMRGTVVEFTNSDDVQHNVFSPSAIAGKFNLGTYGPGATRTVTLEEPGDVRVLCNIHMEMEAHILVLNTPYFATVAEDGSYRVSDVPAGTYQLKIWHERWLAFSQTVELPETGNHTVNITVRK